MPIFVHVLYEGPLVGNQARIGRRRIRRNGQTINLRALKDPLKTFKTARVAGVPGVSLYALG